MAPRDHVKVDSAISEVIRECIQAQASRVSSTEGLLAAARVLLEHQERVCGYCRRVGHTTEDCWKRRGLCLKCGASDHEIKDCQRYKIKEVEVPVEDPLLPTDVRAEKVILCSFCQLSGHVRAECWRAKKLCLICGSSDHRAKLCPRSFRRGVVVSGPRVGTTCSKRPFSAVGGDSVDLSVLGEHPQISVSTPMMAASSQTVASGVPVQCDFCHKGGHTRDRCWKEKGWCLLCGGADHRAAQCPKSRKNGGSYQGSQARSSAGAQKKAGNHQAQKRIRHAYVPASDGVRFVVPVVSGKIS